MTTSIPTPTTMELPYHPTQRARQATQIASALEQVNRDNRPLGAIVTWNLERALVSRDALLDLLAKRNLTLVAPLPIRPKTAMSRALKEMDHDHLVSMLSDNKKYTVYALINQQVTEGDEHTLPDVAYDTTLRMVWYKGLGNDPDDALAFDNEEIGERFRPVVARYMTSHTAGDVSSALLRVIKLSNGISLRSNGGVYFVPHTDLSSELLSSARALVEDIETLTHHGSFFSSFTIPDSDEHKNDMRAHVAQDLEADIKRLDDDIAEKEQTARQARIKRQVNADSRASGVNADTVAKYLSVADALDAKASLYVDLLRFNADAVQARLESLRSRLARLIDASAQLPL